MSTELDHVTAIIRAIGKIPRIAADQDFYDAGFSSIKALQLLMELEEALSISIPDDRFMTARTARALHEIVVELQEGVRR